MYKMNSKTVNRERLHSKIENYVHALCRHVSDQQTGL